MSTIAITAQTFNSQIEKGIVVLDFWASWCAPCRAFAPIFEAASNKHPDITWGKVDTEEEQELAGALQIRSIPTIMVFRDGILLFEQAGLLPGAALEQLIGKVRALDMDAIKKEIEQAKVA